MRRAFTLVEQLAALALAALLTAAAIGVLAGIARDRASLRPNEGEAGLERAAELIRADLAGSQRLEPWGNGFSLNGFASIDSASLAPGHRPVRITYQILKIGNESSLVRTQESLDVLSNRNTDAQLVCDEVAAVSIRPVVTGRPATRPADPSGARSTVPQAVRLILTPARTNRPPLMKVLCLR